MTAKFEEYSASTEPNGMQAGTALIEEMSGLV
jgi:hypothetical protein